VMIGPFGPYLQLGEVVEDGPKPKRVSIPKTVDPKDVDLDLALKYLALPRRLGHHPTTNLVVNAGIGRFGPYVTSNKVFKSLGKDHDVLTVDLDTAVALLATAKPRGPAPPLKELGKHPDDGEAVGIYEGRYGMYVKHGKVNATIPKEREIDSVTLEDALEWIAARAGKVASKKKATRKKATKKKATKKKASKKKAAKKKASKKKAAKKKSAEDAAE
jgi:DNA topoisomerase-1